MVRDAERSKQNILQVAEKIFAQKGFDGARVDEIAKVAGVNKALLYYYFKSKRQILEEIIQQSIDMFLVMFDKYADQPEEKNESEKISQFFSEFLPVLESKKDLMRIIVAESLKSGNDDPFLFKIMELPFDTRMAESMRKFRDHGYHIDEEEGQMLVTEFFTGLMPIINYVVYRDKWARFFKVGPDDLKSWFMKAYEKTHVAHHIANME